MLHKSNTYGLDLHVTLLFYSVRNLILGSRIKELTLKIINVIFSKSVILQFKTVNTKIYKNYISAHRMKEKKRTPLPDNYSLEDPVHSCHILLHPKMTKKEKACSIMKSKELIKVDQFTWLSQEISCLLYQKTDLTYSFHFSARKRGAIKTS